MKITKGPIAGKKVVMADSTQVEQHKENIDKLLRLIGEYMGWEEEDYSYVFVSDQSSLGDFLQEESEIQGLGTKLGFSVTRRDLVYETAMRMGKAN